MPKYLMPVGNTDFKEIRETGLYYIDKTMLIDQLVGKSRAKVTLFTRPRRFGKSLNMSMLQHFFDIREKSESLFEGLAISKNKALCDSWMNQYPTILVSFKDVGSSKFDTAYALLKGVISKLYESHKYLFEDNDSISKMKRKLIDMFLMREADAADLTDCLYLLTDIMYHKYENTPVILLIDEYDVPMAKGDANGYYRDITDIMSVMLSKALKDNPYIKFAVLTGCLRIAKESIFTGLNNPKIYSILDYGFEEFFGFTDSEIDCLLADTGFTGYKEKIKQWYDGYHFGDTDIYCPWDVLNYVSDLQQKAGIEPKNYWANTSGNDVIRQYLESDNVNPHSDFETLLAGKCIRKTIAEDITYDNLLSSEENFWSVLLMTGYLTVVPKDEVDAENVSNDTEGVYLRLVNNEIKELFSRTVGSWFKNKMLKEDRTELFKAIWSGDAETITDELCGFLGDSISFYDYHEIFYHAFLTGLLSGVKGIIIKSNSETGTGRADVVLQYPRKGLAAIFEFKSAKSEAAMNKKCDEALKQIETRKYSFPFRHNTVLKYGIAFFEKQCLVKKG